MESALDGLLILGGIALLVAVAGICLWTVINRIDRGGPPFAL